MLLTIEPINVIQHPILAINQQINDMDQRKIELINRNTVVATSFRSAGPPKNW